MKIVATDNYARETVADVLVIPFIHPWLAKYYCTGLNRPAAVDDPNLTDYWYIVVPDDYRLWRGMENLV